mmetsp:Transcript_44499/g.129398  ORF Transcript_44499/g.129398 Transcript_44499/m.129398 type:complete len:358 (+) Transcript_44499:535-1608(+)
MLLFADGERHGVDRPEELVRIADQVQRGHLGAAPESGGLPCGREVAILDAESRDDAPTDHGAVPPVVETRHGHSPFGLAHDEDAAYPHLLRQSPEDPMHFGAPMRENLLVELPPLFGLLHHGLRLRAIRQLALGVRSVQTEISPIRRGVRRLNDARQVAAAVLSTGHAVGRDHQETHAGQRPGISHVIVGHAAAAMHEEHRAGHGRGVVRHGRQHRAERARAALHGTLPHALHLVREGALGRVLQRLVDAPLLLLRQRLRLAEDVAPVAPERQGLQLPDPAEPQALLGVSFVVDVRDDAVDPNRLLGQADEAIPHYAHVGGRLDWYILHGAGPLAQGPGIGVDLALVDIARWGTTHG